MSRKLKDTRKFRNYARRGTNEQLILIKVDELIDILQRVTVKLDEDSSQTFSQPSVILDNLSFTILADS
jgi:hypothetical protein